MKRLKVIFASLVAIAVIGAVFAFSPKKQAYATRYFEFNSTATYDDTNLKIPSNWTESTSGKQSDDVTGFTHEIAIIAPVGSQGNYIYANGTPKVDVNTSLQNAVLASWNGGATPSEQFDTDFEIYTNTSR